MENAAARYWKLVRQAEQDLAAQGYPESSVFVTAIVSPEGFTIEDGPVVEVTRRGAAELLVKQTKLGAAKHRLATPNEIEAYRKAEAARVQLIADEEARFRRRPIAFEMSRG